MTMISPLEMSLGCRPFSKLVNQGFCGNGQRLNGVLRTIIIDPRHDAIGIGSLSNVAWAIAEDIHGGEVTLNPSTVYKMALAGPISPVLRPYLARKGPYSQYFIHTLLIRSRLAQNRQRYQRREQNQPTYELHAFLRRTCRAPMQDHDRGS